MTEPSMTLGSTPGADPGNSEPEAFTEDLTDDETLQANAVVEAAIQLLPVDNEGCCNEW
jgi:hypothetical protein